MTVVKRKPQLSTRMPDAVGPTKFPKKKLDDHIPRRRRDFNNGIAKVGVVYFDKQVGASHAVRWSKSFSNLNCYTNLTSQELVLLNLDWMVEIFFFFFFCWFAAWEHSYRGIPWRLNRFNVKTLYQQQPIANNYNIVFIFHLFSGHLCTLRHKKLPNSQSFYTKKRIKF